MDNIPVTFLEKYIRPAMRERVNHEWRKRPDKLRYRVSHKSEELFASICEGGGHGFVPDDLVYVLASGTHAQMQWHDAMEFIGYGDGVLIISESGDKFYAESEAMPGAPSIRYGNSP